MSSLKIWDHITRTSLISFNGISLMSLALYLGRPSLWISDSDSGGFCWNLCPQTHSASPSLHVWFTEWCKSCLDSSVLRSISLTPRRHWLDGCNHDKHHSSASEAAAGRGKHNISSRTEILDKSALKSSNLSGTDLWLQYFTECFLLCLMRTSDWWIGPVTGWVDRQT